MKLLSLSLALGLSLGTALPAIATPVAMPLAPAGASLAIAANGCHAAVRDNYVPEIGQRAPHYHRQRDCRSILVEDRPNERRKPADCHRDVREHRIGGVMLRHRHVGDDCQVREVRRSTG